MAHKRNMSQAEINRRKKAQGAISRTTGALGLASLGAFGASKLPGSRLGARLAPKLNAAKPATWTTQGGLKAKRKAPFGISPAGEKFKSRAENIALGTSTAGAGIGGAGSFNFASYTAAESRQRKRKQVAKSDRVSAFGIEH